MLHSYINYSLALQYWCIWHFLAFKILGKIFWGGLMNIYFISSPKVCFLMCVMEIFQSFEQLCEHTLVLRKHSSIMFCFIIIIHRKSVFKNLLYPWPWRTDEIIPWQRHQVKWFKLCMQLSICVFPQHCKSRFGITNIWYLIRRLNKAYATCDSVENTEPWFSLTALQESQCEWNGNL